MGALISLGKDMEFDSSLLSGLPMAANKPVSERGPFDAMLIQQYQEQLERAIKSLEEAIAGGEAVAAEHAPKVQAAATALEVARTREQEAADDVAAGDKELEELSEQERAAKKAVRDVGPELRKGQTSVARPFSGLEKFRAAHLAPLEFLRDRDSQLVAAPEPKEAEPEAEQE